MKLSIAMTTFDGEAFVEEQLASLIKQTRPADEVVIVDDASRDQTAERVAAFIERHDLSASGWALYRNDRRIGFKANFYKAVSLTTGERIALCDQDDVWDAKKLEKMENAFDANGDIRSLGCGFRAVNAEGERLALRGNILPESFEVEDGAVKKLPAFETEPLMLLKSNTALGCTMMIDRRTADAYLRYSKGEIAHDWEMNLIAAAEDGLYYLNEPLIEYRLHEKNAIGLRRGKAGGLRVDLAGRKGVHSGFEGALRFIEGYKPKALTGPFAARLDGYARTRRELLDKKSAKALFRLWVRYADIYKKMYTPRQLAGDVFLLFQLGDKKGEGN